MRAAVLDLDPIALPCVPERLDGYDAAFVLLRVGGRPAGRALIPLFGRSPSDLADLRRELLCAADSAFWEAWRRQRLAPRMRPGDGPSAEPGSAELAARPATVAVCTRERPADLRRCLGALRRLPHDGQELLVVDNRPATGATRAVVAEFPGVRYVREDRPGLDAARNRALREARHELVAFTDDDAAPDSGWLRALARNFADERVLCVTGLTVPLELETEAQVLFERLGGFGRGTKRFTLDSAYTDPLTAWRAGAGVNMALRKDVLERVGPFDEALDVGTPTAGGGDTDMFRRILSAGYRIVYDPEALVGHRHRRRREELRRQFRGFDSAGFAIRARCLFLEGDPRAIRDSWWWGRYILRNLVDGLRGRPGALPADLLRARVAGALIGPAAYLAGTVRARVLGVGPRRSGNGPRRSGGRRDGSARSRRWRPPAHPEPQPDRERIAADLVESLESLVREGAADRAVVQAIRDRRSWFGPPDLESVWGEQHAQWAHLEARLRAGPVSAAERPASAGSGGRGEPARHSGAGPRATLESTRADWRRA